MFGYGTGSRNFYRENRKFKPTKKTTRTCCQGHEVCILPSLNSLIYSLGTKQNMRVRAHINSNIYILDILKQKTMWVHLLSISSAFLDFLPLPMRMKKKIDEIFVHKFPGESVYSLKKVIHHIHLKRGILVLC